MLTAGFLSQRGAKMLDRLRSPRILILLAGSYAKRSLLKSKQFMSFFGVGKKKAAVIGIALLPILLSACTNECATLRTYSQPRNREEIAIVRSDLLPVVRVNAVDGRPVRGDVCFFMVEPGRHEFILSYGDGRYVYHNVSKYFEAAAGHTYRLKLNVKVSFWSNPEHTVDFLDVTKDQQLHLINLPEKGRYHRE